MIEFVQVDCLLVIAVMYVKHRGWIQSEIEAAEEFGKRIIVVERWGQERFPTELEFSRKGWLECSFDHTRNSQ